MVCLLADKTEYIKFPRVIQPIDFCQDSLRQMKEIRASPYIELA